MKLLLSFCLILTSFIFSPMPMKAQEGFIIEDGILISYIGTEQDIVIPDDVIEIHEKAFYENKTITSVTMGNQVSMIESEAFAYCENLEQIILSKQLERIGADAFQYTKQLRHLYLPASLKYIDYCDNGIFYESGLEHVYIAEGMEEVPYYLFKNAKQLKEVYLPQSILKIQDGAFYHCSQLQMLELPYQLTYLGDHCFYRCEQLSDIVLPSKLEYMGADVFQGCRSLTKINIPKALKRIALTSDGIFYETNLQEVSFEAGITILPQYLFKGASSLTNITLPDTLEQIQDGAFYGCDGLSEIYLPANLVHLRRHAFASCKNLRNVYGLEKLTYFDEKAFSSSPQICLYVTLDSLVYQAALNKGWNYVLMTSPQPVSNVMIEQKTNTQLQISWESDGINDGYEVSYYEETTPDRSYQIQTLEKEIIIDDLKVNGNYVFEVKALNQYPHIQKQSEVMKVVQTQKLLPIQIIQIEQASSTALKISWEASEHADGYALYRSTQLEGKYYFMGTYDATKTSAIIKGQQTGRSYYYKMKALKDGKESLFSDVKSGQSILYQNQLKYLQEEQLLSWNAVSGASYYQLYRAQGHGAKFQKIVTLNKNARQYQLAQNAFFMTTYYKIRGYKKYQNEYIYSNFSNIVKVEKNKTF